MNITSAYIITVIPDEETFKIEKFYRTWYVK